MKRKSSNKKKTAKKEYSFRYMDKTLLVASLLLLIFGIVMILSASSIAAVREYGRPENFFAIRQTIWAVMGLVASLVIIKMKERWYSPIALLGIFFITAILLITLIHGKATNGATSWLYIGPFSFQPSEFAKTFLILHLACTLGGLKKIDGLQDLIWIFGFPAAIFFLVLIQPDMGTGLIILFITLAIFYALPIKRNKTYFLYKVGILAALIVGISLIFYLIKTDNNLINSVLTKEQQERISEFAKPCTKYEDSGYQACHGYIAINSGGLLGEGIGKSTQKFLYLPEAYTDFIFPIIVEELGIIVAGIILLVYLIILYRIFVIARTAKDLRGSIIAYGTLAYITAHIIINLGGVLAIMPLTGVPLPFLSYGGSFLINLMMLLAFTQKVAIERELKSTSTQK